MAVKIEDAGFEIRDMIAWVYGSGFPKSLDVSKAIDKAAGAERERIGRKESARDCPRREGWERPHHLDPDSNSKFITAPATDAARQWAGWGTALKPALEPITVARKPLIGTVAANVLEHGTGAINVDGCRVGTETITQRLATVVGGKSIGAKAVGVPQKATGETTQTIGRWPANLIHDGSDEVVGLFPVTGASKATPRNNGDFKSVAKGRDLPHVTYGHDDNGGSAARFFYCAKASKKDRDEGCDHLPEHQEGLQLPRGKCPDCGTWKNAGEEQCKCGGKWEMTSNPPPKARNNHPTVKPTALMRYLCRLVTPPEGIVLDPFMGSGSTGKAAVIEGFNFIGIEREESYMEIAEARINSAKTPA
jgi:site-specific DNA-methyltransferase (adenine-specific)